MKKNRVKEIIKKGKVALGPFMKFTDPASVEIAGKAGFDFVIIDMEHGPVSVETAQNLIRAAELVNITPIIRVTENEPGLILRALDIGAGGVEVPQIGNKDDALRLVQSSKFAPQGSRGVCRFVRAADYSASDRYRYFEDANRETIIIPHIEGTKGISNLEEILSVKGLDIIFVGPYDLSQSLNIPGQVEDPKVVEKMREVVSISQKAGLAVGTFVDDVKAAKKWIAEGVQYISFSVDVGIFYEACKSIVRELKGM